MKKGGFNCSSEADFIRESKATHGQDRYDYSLLKYVNLSIKVIIICPKHGQFEQRPYSHLQGCGCRKCAQKNAGKYLAIDTSEFIKRARTTHGQQVYDYSLTQYTKQGVKVKIGCPTHGQFEQEPTSHIAGNGCPDCAHACRAARLRARGAAAFISRARAQHGDRYDYSQVLYTDAWGKVKIGCSEHGFFEQVAIKHSGEAHGCPQCARDARKGKPLKNKWDQRVSDKVATLYLIKLFNREESFYKVGVTCNSVKARYYPANLSGYQYEIMALYKSINAAAVYGWEQSILETFAHLRYKPEVYFAGETECFSSCEEILAIFPL